MSMLNMTKCKSTNVSGKRSQSRAAAGATELRRAPASASHGEHLAQIVHALWRFGVHQRQVCHRETPLFV
ncbi:hypothetical protein KM864_04045 [Ralstonia solanacearum]|nr:hypothetical protein H1A20_04195 [Ralstonia solanacearum]QWF61769.1 hypothetical protein KM864_04045 [Ralstonia solanacearum]